MFDFLFDLIEDHTAKIVAVVVGGAVIMACYEAYVGVVDPCVKYGPERLSHFQQVGTVMVPIYSKSCIQRRSEAAP